MNRNGRAPQAGSVAPQAGKAPSQAGQASSQAGSVAPQAGDVAPQAGSVAPQARKAPSQARKAPSQARKAPSQARKAPSQAGKVAPQAGRATPQPRRRTLAAYQPKAAMAQRLLAAQTALDTTLRDPVMLELLAAHGYDTAKILEGQALIAAARARHQQQRDHRGDWIAATDTLAASHAAARAIYQRQVAIARVALRDDRSAAQKLDLAARQRRLAGWLLQAQQFYANALCNAAIVEALERYGVTRPQLEQGQALVAEVMDSHGTKQQRNLVVEASTQARDAAFAALDRWMYAFKTIARIALASQPPMIA